MSTGWTSERCHDTRLLFSKRTQLALPRGTGHRGTEDAVVVRGHLQRRAHASPLTRSEYRHASTRGRSRVYGRLFRRAAG
jgi:hypothetical protein